MLVMLFGVDVMLVDFNCDIGELWMEMIIYSYVDGQVYLVVGFVVCDMMDWFDEEVGLVLFIVKFYLVLYCDFIVVCNVSKFEFKIKDLMYYDNVVSFYIVMQLNDKVCLWLLVWVMVNMIVCLLVDKMDFENGWLVVYYKYCMLMMFDEFFSLGKFEIMQELLVFVVGYGIKCYLICQDINQFKSCEIGYGYDESIMLNCYVQNVYLLNCVEMVEYFFKFIGQIIVVKEQIIISGWCMSVLLGQVLWMIQEVQCFLFMFDECLCMFGLVKIEGGDIVKVGDMVVYVVGYFVIYGKQLLYF